MKLQMCSCGQHGGLLTEDGKIAFVASKVKGRKVLDQALSQGMIDEGKKASLLAEVKASGFPEEGETDMADLLGAMPITVIEVRVSRRGRGLSDLFNF